MREVRSFDFGRLVGSIGVQMVNEYRMLRMILALKFVSPPHFTLSTDQKAIRYRTSEIGLSPGQEGTLKILMPPL